MTEYMRNSDAFTWSMESDPRLRSTVVTVILLDRTPDWDAMRSRFETISADLPMFRERVVYSPLSAPPRWVPYPDFDLDFHIRRVRAPAPGTFDTVLEMARIAAMEDFDRARPLWKTTLVDGLTDGGAAVVCKFHHALTDGVGAIEIAMRLFDLTEESDHPPGTPDAITPPDGEAWWRDYLDSMRFDAERASNTVMELVKSVPGLAFDTIRHPIATAGDAVETAASVYRTVRPVNETGSSLVTDRSLVRHLDVHEVPLQQLRDAGHRGGGSLNDAFVAGVAGGLRLYHEKHGVEVGDLHLCMPVNLRTDDDAPGGNRITLMRFDVPVGEADPAQRIARIHRRTSRVREERSLPYTQLIAGAMNLMPRWYIGSVLRHVDFLCSDVPGIPVPLYLGGARMTAQYAFGPTIGAAVNVTLLSYIDTCELGIDVDTGAIGDVDVFHACLVDGFDEVLSLTRSAS
ncbi:wax ester/triacylglycerol synthase domain-containing protein [Gordonia rubripertincta]|uniref:wax ester/triacylglycerol synthase domain-containing protein n=1 Tax=Gordonia rubripertincta TaxID=36822 RepID=UPI000B8D42A9|nr:wax ester/triacylglycerol synthase domain-containing protein [Gordonia rubripertincta]ASR01585.1 Putative diacylglycerol O-acyltransferase [Gordonia rubripertincta]